MKRIFTWSFGLALLVAAPVFGQKKATVEGVPEMPFTAVPNFLKLPARISRRIRSGGHQLQGDMFSSITAAPTPGCSNSTQRAPSSRNRRRLLRLRIRPLGACRQRRQHLGRR